ncbi:MAG: hypothetical protein KGJ89_00415 [Patescibacteria group bacterium]|nr:hypothetical protein [Patescibacteria group bacterium]MDE2014984.1 hypothetical protein [Patescibacteria group bacterium]MDE2226413.1 hypothetical protein [Patescibacteria group bacterium]
MKSVVFCSSVRFKKELGEFITQLKIVAAEKGLHPVILEPNFEDRSPNFEKLHEKDRLNEPNYRETVAGKVYDHLFRKVRVADVCFIFNKDGYLGVNTTGELFAAAMAGKMCYALNPKTLMGSYPNDLYEEPSSQKLIHEAVSTPEELLKRLA